MTVILSVQRRAKLLNRFVVAYLNWNEATVRWYPGRKTWRGDDLGFLRKQNDSLSINITRPEVTDYVPPLLPCFFLTDKHKPDLLIMLDQSLKANVCGGLVKTIRNMPSWLPPYPAWSLHGSTISYLPGQRGEGGKGRSGCITGLPPTGVGSRVRWFSLRIIPDLVTYAGPVPIGGGNLPVILRWHGRRVINHSVASQGSKLWWYLINSSDQSRLMVIKHPFWFMFIH